MQRLFGLRGGVGGDLGADAGGGQNIVGSDGIVLDWADEVFGPLLECTGFAVGTFTVRLSSVDPVEVRLEVAIGTGYVSAFDGEEDVAAVVGPVRTDFKCLVVG